MIGQRLGHFEISAKLGEGGMGEVYRARDTKLGRDVAIKLLLRDVPAEGERLRRFEQEVLSTSSLNHPNILTVYEVGEHESAPYLVTELLEGKSLRERLRDGPLPARKAAEYGAQIARGLAAAHAKGIVHRDLKPENLFVTRDDRVKILDFGLAKLLPATGMLEDEATMALEKVTGAGTVLGTVGYMSPEQVRAQEVDGRSDIFSLGVVTYEMVTGERAFRGDSAVATLNAILASEPAEPDPELDVPPVLERVLRHCLEKEPAHRFQSALDLAFQLESLAGASRISSTALPAAAVGAPRRRSRRLSGLTLALLAAAATGFLIGRPWGGDRSPAQPPQERTITYSGADGSATVSPDGHTLAFTSIRNGPPTIWLKRWPSGDEVAIAEGGNFPRFSPDGSEVLFVHERGLFRVPVLGGTPRKIADAAVMADWSPDGEWIVLSVPNPLGSELRVMRVDGSEERLLHRSESWIHFIPRYSPDGGRVAFTPLSPGANSGDPLVGIVDVATGDLQEFPMTLGGGGPLALTWNGDGRSLIYAQPMAQTQFSQMRIVLHDLASGTARVLAFVDSQPTGLDVMSPGRIVLSTDDIRSRLQEVSLTDPNTPTRTLSHGSSIDRQPRYTPDGEWVLFSSDRLGNLDLWAASSTSGEIRRLTDHPGIDWDPDISADGSLLLWTSDRSGNFEIWIADADGRNPRQVTTDGQDAENPTISPDNRWIVYNSAHTEKAGIWKIRPDGSDAERLVAGVTGLPEISPDGRWVAYTISTQPTSGIARVVGIDGTPANFEINCETSSAQSTTVAVARSRWTPDGRAIGFICGTPDGDIAIMVQDFVPGEDTRSSRRILAHGDGARVPESFDFSPDGALLMISEAEIEKNVELIDNLPGVEPAPR